MIEDAIGIRHGFLAAQHRWLIDILRVATLVMGSLAKQQFNQPTNRATANNDLFSMLTPMLDQNRDGSVVDDILKNVTRMMGGPRQG